MAVDYEGVNGVVQNLSDAKTQIGNLEGKFTTSTLLSDSGALSSLKTNHTTKLSENIETTETQLTNGINSMKHIEECVKSGKNWN